MAVVAERTKRGKKGRGNKLQRNAGKTCGALIFRGRLGKDDVTVWGERETFRKGKPQGERKRRGKGHKSDG